MFQRVNSSGGLPVFKLPVGCSVSVLVCSEQPLVHGVHWSGERNELCVGENCPGCNFSGPRIIVAAVVRVQRGDSREVVAFAEFSQSAWAAMRGMASAFSSSDTLEGAAFTMSRSRKKGAVLPVGYDGRSEVDEVLRSQKLLVSAWARLWRLHCPLEGESFERYEARMMEVVRGRWLLMLGGPSATTNGVAVHGDANPIASRDK